jgi:hypothetical protein
MRRKAVSPLKAQLALAGLPRLRRLPTRADERGRTLPMGVA